MKLKIPSFFVIKLEALPHFLYTIVAGGLEQWQKFI